MTEAGARFGWRTLLCACVCLGLSVPPGWLPGAPFLVLPGLAGFYALALRSTKPLRAAYVLGVLHMVVVSWSLHHLHWSPVLAISLTGGLYYVLNVVWLRGWPSRMPRALVFACGVAATQWLRAEMPDIGYPHGQFCHALYEWPTLLGAVAWGGEPLANFLLAWIAASAVDLYNAWRTEAVDWVRARRGFATAVVSAVISCAIARTPAPAGEPGSVAVAAVQLGSGIGFRADRESHLQALRSLDRVTADLLRADSMPDVVVWPEATSPFLLWDKGRGIDLYPAVPGRDPQWLPAAVTFVSCAELVEGLSLSDGDRYVAAVAVRGRRYVGHFEKRRLVPAGEHPPLIGWLPAAWAEAMIVWGSSLVGGALPNICAGRPQALLETAAGVPFGALICYDNAYPDVARDQVARGARFLVVLSNETWYGRGNELDQHVALTVCRALETATPIVRSTVDGATVHVDAQGVIVAGIPYGTGPQVLRAKIALGPGSLAPFAWLHTLVRWSMVLTGLPFLAHLLCFWARIAGVRRGRDPLPGSK